MVLQGMLPPHSPRCAATMMRSEASFIRLNAILISPFGQEFCYDYIVPQNCPLVTTFLKKDQGFGQTFQGFSPPHFKKQKNLPTEILLFIDLFSFL
jgi:hypothetical protein